MDSKLIAWAAAAERRQFTSPIPRSLDPLAAEIIAARLIRILGIGAPESVLEVPKGLNPDKATWIVKSLQSGRMKQGDGEQRRIMVKRIPCAISLTALSVFYGISVDSAPWDIPVQNIPQSCLSAIVQFAHERGLLDGEMIVRDRALLTDDLLVANVRQFLIRGHDPMPREFFADFIPPADWSAVRAAIAPESQAMLDIHAARAFLACSTAHAGNILVDAAGKLYSIDHEFCALSDPTEIDLLKNRVRPGTRAHRAMQKIADVLDEKTVRELFEDLPEVDWPMGDRETTVGYFLQRFERWSAMLT